MNTNLIVFLSGFLGGVFLHSFFDLGYYFSLFFLLIGVAIFLYYLLNKVALSHIFLVALFFISAGLGLLRYDISDFYKGDENLEKIVGQKIEARVIVIQEPDEREFNTRITVSIEEILILDEWISTDSNAIMSINHYPEFKYGDLLEIKGVLQKPENFDNKNGREFNYISYLAKDDIFYQIFNAEAKFSSSGNGNIIKENLFLVKNKFLESIQKTIPEPHSALLGGLVVGAKESLGEDILEDFRKTGIIHIVVLSGYNVTIVALAIMGIFSFLPRLAGISLGGVSIVLFAIMTGASATIVRASIMAIFVILAKATGRLYEITIALFIAGFVMILHNPKILVFDPSFQLSFLATMGLIYAGPMIGKYFKLVTGKFGFRDFAIATVATQIFVLPLLLFMTGEISLVSLPVNLLILVFVPITMLFGFLAGIIGMLSVIISMPFAFVSYALLAYQLKVVDIFAKLPFASVEIKFFPFWIVLVIYIIYIWIIYKMKRKNDAKD